MHTSSLMYSVTKFCCATEILFPVGNHGTVYMFNSFLYYFYTVVLLIHLRFHCVFADLLFESQMLMSHSHKPDCFTVCLETERKHLGDKRALLC